MPAADVPLVIDQGEDFTAQIVWTDAYDTPQKLTTPMQMDIKDLNGSTVVSLTVPNPPPTDGSIPPIDYSSDIGMIQLHIPKSQTVTMLPGMYNYDLFVSVDDGNVYAGVQQVRLMAGQVTVNKRITQI